MESPIDICWPRMGAGLTQAMTEHSHLVAARGIILRRPALASCLVNLLCRQVRLVATIEIIAPDTPI